MPGPNLSPIGSSAHLYPLPALSYLSAVRPTNRIVPHLLRGSLPLFELLMLPPHRWTSLPALSYSPSVTAPDRIVPQLFRRTLPPSEPVLSHLSGGFSEPWSIPHSNLSVVHFCEKKIMRKLETIPVLVFFTNCKI